MRPGKFLPSITPAGPLKIQLSSQALSEPANSAGKSTHPDVIGMSLEFGLFEFGKK
jgi:hypothetical protein